MKEKEITLTKELIDAGMSVKGGWSSKQLELLGTTFKNKGWKKELIGTPVKIEDYNKFLELKDKHLKQQ